MYGVCQGRRPHENDGSSSRQRASHLKIKSSAIWSPSMVIDPNRPFNSETCLTELYRKRRETNLWRCVTDDGQKNRQEQKKNLKKTHKSGPRKKRKRKDWKIESERIGNKGRHFTKGSGHDATNLLTRRLTLRATLSVGQVRKDSPLTLCTQRYGLKETKDICNDTYFGAFDADNSVEWSRRIVEEGDIDGWWRGRDPGTFRLRVDVEDVRLARKYWLFPAFHNYPN